MAVASIAHYEFPAKDRVENFHGNQLVYLHWEDHLMFCAPVAFPLPPTMSFRGMIENVLTPAYSPHPDFEKIDWAAVRWTLDDVVVEPEWERSLAENKVGHKSLLRFITPGLEGIDGKHF
ncbi:phenol hydroxylase (plasmid) [Sphingobium sp. SCG-1]|uniref:phenol hydroxylase subunit P4 n=1 Tax=Sphingobium sp. SCG-1 TaxID=2072936 RepID=UPI000CD69CA0|nr:phenol hydroxylase subunit P4 [Sphingobium sp. SCG-1]AUW60554.1 phenol hydroxylase [Sphingobium sp. SCG-1]